MSELWQNTLLKTGVVKSVFGEQPTRSSIANNSLSLIEFIILIKVLELIILSLREINTIYLFYKSIIHY